MYNDEEDYDSMHYDMELKFAVRVAKWRMNDPRKPANHVWCVYMYDVNKGEFINLGSELDREGEYFFLEDVKIIASKELRVPKIPAPIQKIN